MSKPTQILFVRQRHDAKRAGLHNDYRVVIGEKAFSWASRKDFPEIGKPTILWEQPVHHAAYLNNPDITIPEGQYGAGTQVIDYAQKGNAVVQNDAYHLELNNGDRFLIKKAPDSYGEKAWLFLRKKKMEDKKNPYLEKSAEASPGAEALGGAAVLAVADVQHKKLMRKGVKNLRDHHKEYMATTNKAGKPFSAPYMEAMRKGATKNIDMEKSLMRKSKAIRGAGAAIGGGLLAHSLYRAVTEKRASENPYLEKVAALGSSDMAAARSHINKKREESGKSEIGFHDFKEQFEDRRGVSRRVVGTLGLANVGALLNKYNPAAGALVGGVAGYYLGKSFDNKNARKNMIKEAAEDKRTKTTAAKEVAVGAYGLSHVSKAPSKLLGYHNMYHGTSKENAKSILKNGLNKSKGGSRGSRVDIGGKESMDYLVNNSKKHVYMTKSKFVGRSFAGDSAKHINTHGVNSIKGTIETLKDGFKNGKVLKARVSHGTWEKGFKMDPDSFPESMRMFGDASKLKPIAARSRHNVSSKSFVGGEGAHGIKAFATKNNLRRYYSTASGKARGKLGAFQLAAGAALTAGAAMHNKNNGGVLSKAK